MVDPAVARRSPASTTPSPYRRATMVVPWVMGSAGSTRSMAARSRRDRRSSSLKSGPGSAPGGKRGRLMWRRRLPSPRDDQDRATAGSPRLAQELGGLLPAFLDVRAHELLGVVLEDLVDLVEEVVELGLQL